MKRLAAILLTALPAYASEPPFLPVAVCDQGICTMKQEDYEKFRQFHAAGLEGARIIIQQNERLENQVAELSSQIARNAYCQFKRT